MTQTGGGARETAEVIMNEHEQISAALSRLIEAGMTGQLDELVSLLHDDVVMVFPGFAGRADGKAAVLAGFEEFSNTATVQGHEEQDQQIDIVGDVAVCSYRFIVTFERGGQAYRSTGRDLWVFRREAGTWRAIWRTMLDLADE